MNAFAHRYGILPYYKFFVNVIEVAKALQTAEKTGNFFMTFIDIDFNNYLMTEVA